MTMSGDVRDHSQGAVAFETDDGKIPSVGGKDRADVLPLGKMGESGVGELEAQSIRNVSYGRDGGQITTSSVSSENSPPSKPPK